jgi:hypothetical protein
MVALNLSGHCKSQKCSRQETTDATTAVFVVKTLFLVLCPALTIRKCRSKCQATFPISLSQYLNGLLDGTKNSCQVGKDIPFLIGIYTDG